MSHPTLLLPIAPAIWGLLPMTAARRVWDRRTAVYVVLIYILYKCSQHAGHYVRYSTLFAWLFARRLWPPISLLGHVNASSKKPRFAQWTWLYEATVDTLREFLSQHLPFDTHTLSYLRLVSQFPLGILTPETQIESYNMGHYRMELIRHRAVGQGGGTAKGRRRILYIHGGGFCCFGGQVHRAFVSEISQTWDGALVALPFYRKAPEHPFPAALLDLLHAWDHLCSLPTSPSATDSEEGEPMLMGDSAGGGLATSLMYLLSHPKALAQFRQHDLSSPPSRDRTPPSPSPAPKPRAVILFSPWLDLTMSSPSWIENLDKDFLPFQGGKKCVEWYLGQAVAGTPEKHADHPLFSPVYAEDEWIVDSFRDVPLLIHVGSFEVLLHESKVFHQRCQELNLQSKLWIWEEMVHVAPLFGSVSPIPSLVFLQSSRRHLDTLSLSKAASPLSG